MSIMIQTKALPMAFCEQEYSFSMEAKTIPKREVIWSIHKETPIPFGLSMSETGIISGTPLKMQQVSVQIYATTNNPSEITYCILNLNVYEQLKIQMKESWEIFIDIFNEIVLTATGGIPPYYWSCDSLPIGLTLEKDIIKGQPQASGGISPIKISVEDSFGSKRSHLFQLKIYNTRRFP